MTKLADTLQKAGKRLAYWVEHAMLDFTFSIEQRMDDRGVSRAELARRLGTSQAYVTKILAGNANFTMKSMVAMCQVLDARLRIDIVPMEKMENGAMFSRTFNLGLIQQPKLNISYNAANDDSERQVA